MQNLRVGKTDQRKTIQVFASIAGGLPMWIDLQIGFHYKTQEPSFKYDEKENAIVKRSGDSIQLEDRGDGFLYGEASEEFLASNT